MYEKSAYSPEIVVVLFIKFPQRSGYLNRSQGGFLYYGIVSLRCGILVLIISAFCGIIDTTK